MVVRGVVQGVGFRAATRARARSLGVGCEVENRPDGTVAAAFAGERDRVASMVEWCRRGPAGAVVDAVDVVWDDDGVQR